MNLPEFLIIGAPRAGTTTLFNYLLQHPRIFMPVRKEPFFFSFSDELSIAEHRKARSQHAVLDPSEYSALFDAATGDQIRGEASATYLRTHEITIAKLKRYYGDEEPRCIAILRNPVERAYSHWLFNMRLGIETLPFEVAIRTDVVTQRNEQRYWSYDYLGFGLYSDAIAAYINSIERVRVYRFEDLCEPAVLLDDIWGFLDIEALPDVRLNLSSNPSGIPKNERLVRALSRSSRTRDQAKKLVPARVRVGVASARDRLLRRLLTKPKMRHDTRSWLHEFYEDEIRRLEATLGWDLRSWRSDSYV